MSLADSPAGGANNIPTRPRCCCQRTDCPFRDHNGSLVHSLERDVRHAAKLGQALLVRHENYIADSEAERRRMAANIERLEMEKTELETKNARTVQENRDLLDQLERLNVAVAESDATVQSLTATLLSTQSELSRLAHLAARAETLERQLTEVERDQAELQDTLATTAEEERSAIQRWRKAERTIADLHDQMEQIEREARQDRERHEDVVARMERRRKVEKELEAAAGRLKGAAATKTARDSNSSHVVSHFVKDILQDNANLQLGIVELREMLSNSNEEVERLREQLMLHGTLDEPAEGSTTPSLRAELGIDADPVRTTKELHVHHHYHAPQETTPQSPKANKVRKPKPRRKGMTPHSFHSPSGSRHTPHSSISSIRPNTPSSAAAILSQTSVSIPSQHRHAKRFSVQSTISNASFAPSSVPTSPYSHSNRTSSIFDRIFSDNGQEDSSRPTSPESNGSGSPMFSPLQTRPRSTNQTRGISNPTGLKLKPKAAPIVALNATSTPSSLPTDDTIEDLDLFPTNQATIPEEEDTEDSSQPQDQGASDVNIDSEDIYAHMHPAPSLRRAASHESLLSVRGMDIHTYSHRPQAHFLPSTSSTFSMAETSLTAMTGTATRPTIVRQGDSTSYYRSLLSGSAADARSGAGKNGKETKRTGGWLFGKWGSTPIPFPSVAKRGSERAPSSTNPPTPASSTPKATQPDSASIMTSATASSSASTSTPADAGKGKRVSSAPSAPLPFFSRAPGINQPGAIWGLGPEPKAPFKVEVDVVDEEALREGLGEV